MAQKLATAYVEVTADGKQLEKDMRNIRSGVMDNVKQLGAALGSLGLGAAAAGLIKQTVGMAGAAEQTAAAYEIILKDMDQAKALLKDIEDMAATTPFESGDLKQGGRALLAFGATAEEIVPTMRMLGDLAAGSGSNIQEIIRVFNKTRSVGKLTGETFEQFAERGINLQAEITRMLGITGEQFVQMRAKGEISFDLVRQAMQGMVSEGGMFFRAMDAQSQTWKGMLSTISDNVKRLARDMGSAMLPALKAGARVVISFLNGLMALNEATGGFLTQAAAATAAVTALTAAFIAARAAARAFGISMRSALLSLGPIGIAIIAVGLLAGAFMKLVSAIANSKPVMEAWEANVQKFQMAWERLKTAFSNIWSAMTKVAYQALRTIASVFGVELDTLKGDTDNFIAGVIEAFADWVLNAAEWLQVLTENWGLTWELMKAQAWVVLLALKDAVLQFPKWWAYSMGLILGLVIDAFTKILEFVGWAITKIGELLWAMLKATWAGIKSLFTGGTFAEAFQGAAKQVFDSAMSMGEAFKAGWNRTNPMDLWDSSEGLKNAKAARDKILNELAKSKRRLEAQRDVEDEVAKTEDPKKQPPPPPQEVVHKIESGFFAFGDLQRKLQEQQLKAKEDSEKLVDQGEFAKRQRDEQTALLQEIAGKEGAPIASA